MNNFFFEYPGLNDISSGEVSDFGPCIDMVESNSNRYIIGGKVD